MEQGCLNFDGETFDRERDGERLGKQLKAVKDLMKDGQWRTLANISRDLGFPQASISARLRDLRKPKFGGLTVYRQYLIDGLWVYRMGPEDGNEQEN